MDVYGADPVRLRDPRALSALFESLVVLLGLRVLGTPQWHTFPGEGGVTGLAMLSESHLSVHTFPEHGFAALNVYSCREREAPEFLSLCQQHLGATVRVTVRSLRRGESL